MARSLQPTPRRATIFINKLEAARRQLDAAIRMTFANEDELAIHTVAAAAYRILRDMLDKRGRHDLEDLYRTGLYEMAKAFAHGEMSSGQLKNLQLLDDFTYDLVSTISKDIDDLTVDDIPLVLSDSSKKAHWRATSGVSGFLKHADRLPEAMISLEDVNNELLVMHACSAYAMVSHTTTPEMSAYYIFWLIPPERRDAVVDPMDAEIAARLEPLSPSRRRRACTKLIRLFKKWRMEA